MAIKYRVEYTSVNGIEYRIDISSENYIGSVVDITGSAVYGMNSVDSLLYPIRSKFLRLSLLANTEQPLDDLFASNEREWKVEFYRENNKKFFGYLSSEGATQSFVTEERFVDFDALDPLGYLQDLAYVQTNGLPYTGVRQFIQTIAGALKRGFEDENDAFNIVSYINIDYRIRDYGTSGFTNFETGRLPKDVTISQDNFKDFESGEAVSCQKVILDLLGDLHLNISQINGNTWVIGHCMYDNLTMDAMYINSFDKDGNDIADISLNVFNNVGILQDAPGNRNNVLHANENQSYYYKRALQKVSVDYEFRYKESLTLNPNFDGGITGVSMPNWSVGGSLSEASDLGFVRIFRDPNNADPPAIVSNSGTVANSDDKFVVRGAFESNYPDIQLRFNIRATGVIDGLDRYLAYFGTEIPYWVTGFPSNAYTSIPSAEGQQVEFEFAIPQLPVTSEIEIIVSAVPLAFPNDSEIIIYNLGIYGVPSERLGNTQSVKDNTSKSLKAEKTSVSYDTSDSGTKTNQLFKQTTGEPIFSLKNNFILNGSSQNFYENKLGRLHGLQKIIQNRRRIIFSGDFWNFFEPSDILNVSDLSLNKFVPLQYSFDTYKNTGSLTLEERHNSYVDTSTRSTVIFGETIQPKIE